MVRNNRWVRLGITLSLLAVVALTFVACSGAPQPLAPAQAPAATQAVAPTQASASGQEKTKVALLLTGPITDGGWNQGAYEGLKKIEQDQGFEVAYTENVSQAKIPELLRGYGDDGYNLIIGHGFEYGSALLEVAPSYPKQWFFATTFKPQDDIPDNVRYIDPAYFDAAYAAGALAASMSTSKVVGFVGGGDNPTQQNIMKAFIKGAEMTVPGTKALGVVTGDYNNAAKGREAATTMIGNGADVIWHAADVTGLGAIEGAVAKNAKVLGAYSDQSKLAPNNMGSSLVQDLGPMIVTLAQEVRDGKFVGGEEWKPTVKEMWHWQFGDKDHNSAIISDEVWAQQLKLWDDLTEHKIDVNALIK